MFASRGSAPDGAAAAEAAEVVPGETTQSPAPDGAAVVEAAAAAAGESAAESFSAPASTVSGAPPDAFGEDSEVDELELGESDPDGSG